MKPIVFCTAVIALLLSTFFVGMAQPAYTGSLDLPDRISHNQHGNTETIEPWKKPLAGEGEGLLEAPTVGLKGYWPFNGNANDESGGGNDGVVVGATLTDDRFGESGSAYDFDGSDVIRVDNTSNFQLTSWTLAAWIRPESTPSTGYIIVSKEWDANQKTNFGYSLLWTMEVLPGYETCSDEFDHHIFGAYIGLNSWYFTTIVRDDVSGEHSVYINGQLVASANWLDEPCANVARLFFGPPPAGSTMGFDGIIDDIRIYDRALSDEEISDLYNEIPGEPLAQFGVCYGATGSADAANPGALISIDPTTGAGTLIGPTGIMGDNGESVPAMAIKSTGEVYALSASNNSSLYSINASIGAGSYIASTGLVSPEALAFDANDVLYAVSNNNNLYTLNPATGSPTLIGPTGFTTKALSYDPTDGTMYGCSATDGIYTVDLTTGNSTLVGTTGLGGSTHAIHFDQAGRLYGTKGSASIPYTLIEIDKITGEGTTIGPIGFDAVISLASRVISSPVIPVTFDVVIDSSHQFVPAEGDTFAYTMTFTNHTSQIQVIDWWTKVIRPIGDPIDPLSGPELRVLNRFETLVIDTALLPVPFDAIAGDYLLVAYFGRYLSDTLGTDTSAFSKLASIPCEDISRFQTRCRPGGLLQARAILEDTSHTGETLEISIDQFPYSVTIGPNGQAVFSQTGFNPGVHTVELTDPADCFPATTVNCPAGLGKEGDPPWEDDQSRELPATTMLLQNYPDPFNPSTVIRYALSEDAHVTLNVYNVLGQLTSTLMDGYEAAGNKEVVWDGSNNFGQRVASGIYLYRMTAGKYVEIKRMMLMK